MYEPLFCQGGNECCGERHLASTLPLAHSILKPISYVVCNMHGNMVTVTWGVDFMSYHGLYFCSLSA